MPYNSERDEYYWGKCFARDGSDYDPNYESPAFSDAVRVLNRHFQKNTVFHVVFCGKMYKGRSKISAVPGETDLDSIQVISGVLGRSTEWKVARLLGLMEEPEHVTGMFFRALD